MTGVGALVFLINRFRPNCLLMPGPICELPTVNTFYAVLYLGSRRVRVSCGTVAIWQVPNGIYIQQLPSHLSFPKAHRDRCRLAYYFYKFSTSRIRYCIYFSGRVQLYTSDFQSIIHASANIQHVTISHSTTGKEVNQ